MERWVENNTLAQMIGFVAFHYGYSFSEIEKLSPFQLYFLINFVKWLAKEKE